MEDKSPILIILVLFILLGLTYGPSKGVRNQDRLNNTMVTTQTNSTISETQSRVGYSANKETAETIRETEEELKRLEESLTKKIEESRRSPFYNKVRMSQISGVYIEDPNREYIALSTNLERDQTVKITGWYLKSEVTGYSAIIGKAALLPFPFSKTESDAVLQQNDRVYLIKGYSPIGISFRTNKCTGYFEENREFTPSLPLQCPRPSEEDLPKFSTVYDRQDECIDIIERIPRCTTQSSSFIRDLPDTVTKSCKTYITTQINYNSCVANHFKDTDFPGDEYRIYLNKFGSLWRERREKINLHDQNGLIVDSISF